MQPGSLPRIDQGAWGRFLEYGDDTSFLEAWLALLCQITPGARRGWVFIDEGDAISLYAAYGGPGGAPAPIDEALQQAVAEAIETEAGAANPDESSDTRWLVAYPAIAEGRVAAVAALEVQAPDEATPSAAFHQLQWGLGWVLDWLRRQPEEADDDEHPQPPRNAALPLSDPEPAETATAFQIFANVVEAPSFQEAAETLAARLADRLGLDRAAIGLRVGAKTKIVSVSHAAHSERRMEEMRRIEAAMDEALDQRASVAWPEGPEHGDGGEGGALVCRAHRELALAGGPQADGRAAASLPLVASPLDGRERVGALTIEKTGGLSLQERAFFEAVARLAGAVLMEKRLADRSLPAKLWDGALGGVAAVAGPRRPFLKIGLVLGAIALALAIFWPARFELRAPVALEPTSLRIVAAPFEGYLATAEKRAGDRVAAGEALATLDDSDLLLEQTALLADRNRASIQLEEATAKFDQAEAKIQKARLEQLQARLRLVETRLERARIAAPIDGVVVRGDLSRSIGEPMQTGRELFQIAPPNAYRLVLRVDERDVAYVEEGRKGRAVLAALPDETLDFTVSRVAPALEAADGRNFYRVEATLDQQLDGFRPGLEGRGRLDAGAASTLWIWTRELTRWIRMQLWAFWP